MADSRISCHRYRTTDPIHIPQYRSTTYSSCIHRRFGIFIFVTSSLILSFITPTSDGQFLPPLKQKLLIPSYFAPCYNPDDPPHGAMSCPWDQIISDTASHEYSAIGNVIINPSSGPSSSCIADYQNLTNRIRNRDTNLGILGYVHTSYGNRPLVNVTNEIDTYFSCYPPPLLTGIFVDEVSTDCTVIPSYYQSLTNYIRNKGLNTKSNVTTIVYNPGTSSNECYLNVSDILVTFEGDYVSYQTFTPLPWHLSNNATRFAHIIYNTTQPNGQHLEVIRQSKLNNAGNIYVTNGTLPNPYFTLPGPYIYWDQELRWAVDII